MNKIQKRIFLAISAIDTLMGLFPPWYMALHSGTGPRIRNIGYQFIGNAPANATISLTILLVQIATVTFAGAVLLYYFKEKTILRAGKPDPHTHQTKEQDPILAALLAGDVKRAVELKENRKKE